MRILLAACEVPFLPGVTHMLHQLFGSHWTYRLTANWLQHWIHRSLHLEYTASLYVCGPIPTQHPCRCSPPLALQAYRWSGLLKVQSVFVFTVCTVHVFYLSQEVEGQLWAWCGELHPVAVELGVNGSQSSRASLWCSAVGSRGPSPSRSSSAGCTACAGHQPQCLQQQTNLQGNYRQQCLDWCGTISQYLQRYVSKAVVKIGTHTGQRQFE